jgi:hypothetical protein
LGNVIQKALRIPIIRTNKKDIKEEDMIDKKEE